MEKENLNKSLCEMFGGELDVTEGSRVKKSEVRQYKDSLCKMAVEEGKMIQRIIQILEGMKDFCRSMKNMFLSISKSIT